MQKCNNEPGLLHQLRGNMFSLKTIVGYRGIYFSYKSIYPYSTKPGDEKQNVLSLPAQYTLWTSQSCVRSWHRSDARGSRFDAETCVKFRISGWVENTLNAST